MEMYLAVQHLQSIVERGEKAWLLYLSISESAALSHCSTVLKQDRREGHVFVFVFCIVFLFVFVSFLSQQRCHTAALH